MANQIILLEFVGLRDARIESNWGVRLSLETQRMGTKGKKAVFLGVALALQSRNTIDVRIGLRKTKALVDTGSQITLVSQLFFFSKILSMQNSKLSRTDYVIKGVSNNTLPILVSYFFQLKRTAQFSGRLFMSSKV